MDGAAAAPLPAAGAPAGSGLLARIDRATTHVIEAASALLLLAEILLLGTATISRYVFNHPFVWSDELAEYIFIWLAVLGSVVALRRNEHMRLTAFVRGVSPRTRSWLDAIVMALVATLLLALLAPAYEHFDILSEGPSPVMEINEGWRGAAVGVGAILLLITAIQTLLRVADWKQIITAIVLTGAGFAVLTHFGPTLAHLGHGNLIIFFVVFVAVSMAIGMPIAFAFLLGTMSYVAFSTTIPLSIVPDRIEEGMSHVILLAVPLFVVLGALIETAGLARAMINFLVSLIGHCRGGLQYVLLGAMYLVSGISGAKAADMAAVAPTLFPEMLKRGNSEGTLTSLLSASAVMSETIPPSIVLITVGSVTGVSIAALFTGGLLPAVVGMLALAVVVYLQTRREDTSSAPRFSWAQRGKLFLIAIPGLGLPIVIRSAVVEGVATATEVSTIGILYTLVVGPLIYRCFNWRRIYPILVESASLSGAILLVIGAATAMAWALTQSGFSQDLVTMMRAVPGGQTGFLLISAVAFIILGSVLEGVPAIVLFGPLLFPVAALLHVNPIHYAMVAVFAMGFGLFTPPFGVGFYLACAIGRVSPDVAIRSVWPHLAALFVALMLITLLPWISTIFL